MQRDNDAEGRRHCDRTAGRGLKADRMVEKEAASDGQRAKASDRERAHLKSASSQTTNQPASLTLIHCTRPVANSIARTHLTAPFCIIDSRFCARVMKDSLRSDIVSLVPDGAKNAATPVVAQDHLPIPLSHASGADTEDELVQRTS